MSEQIPMTFKEATEFFAEIYYGEHHFPTKIKPYGTGWSICDFDSLSTYDFNKLTRLVFLAHDKCYRLLIRQGGPGTIKIIIWKRYEREGSVEKKHPTLEMAFDSWREDHPVIGSVIRRK
jgi:hypothetical protein